MATITKIKWKDANFKWNDAKGDSAYENFTGHLKIEWDEVFLVEVVSLVSDAGDGVPSIADRLSDLPKQKKKKYIRLIMDFKGVKVYDERKEVKNIKAYAKDVKLIAEEIKRNVQIIY